MGRKLLLCFFLLISITPQALPAPPPQPDDSFLFREGEILLSKGETEKALWRFKTLLTEFPKSSLHNEAKFRMAMCYTQLRRPKDAIRTLNELFSTFLSPLRMAQVITLLGDNEMELRDPLAALQWYGKALLIPGQSSEDLKKKVRTIIDTFDTEEKLNQVEALYRGAYAGGYAKLRLAQLAKRRGNEGLAKRLLAELDKEYRSFNYGVPLKELQSSIPLPEKPRYILGVILPLSGLYRPFGEKALQGIQLAVNESVTPGTPPLIGLAVRDSKGEPAAAERAVEELAIQEKAIAIVGVPLSSTVERAARKCQLMKIPLITLSQKEPLGVKGEFVFQSSLTPSAQAASLAETAVRQLELRTFAVFYPNSPYGHHFKTLFSQEVTGRGGKVAGAVAYQEDQTDLSQEIKTFFRMKAHQNDDPKKTKEERYLPSLFVDGVFIPDTYDRAAVIMTQLDYYNVKGVTFLGTNAWNNPRLLSAAGGVSEGSTFVDAFSRTNPFLSTDRFATEFRKAYSRDPETLEALSYEATVLVREILQGKAVSSPTQLKDEIRRIDNFQGVCGLKGFGEDGRMIRTLSILRVNKGQIEHFSP